VNVLGEQKVYQLLENELDWTREILRAILKASW